MIFSRHPLSRFLLPLALVVAGAALCAILVPAEITAVKLQLLGFPDSDIASHQVRPLIIQALCFLPALASLIYALSGTMDRYIAREFASIFTVCLSALLLIWLIMDLNDKISDFRNAENLFKTLISFYTSRSPAILLLLMPYSLLLSLLYSLGKLSSSREIIAMIQSGRSIIRVTTPLLVAGIFFSLLTLGLNYHWAPIAEGSVDEILSEASGNAPVEAANVIYRDPSKFRLWKIGAFPKDYNLGKPLTDVEVTTTHPDKSIESRLSAKHAYWDKNTLKWTFENATIAHFKANQPTVFEKVTDPWIVDSWTETPFQLIKPGLSAAYLGIPDLTTWLRSNERNRQFASPAPYLTQWHYRWALPFTCLVTVLLATPLAVHFSRRGAGGGIFLAVVLSGLMLLTTNIALALGESGNLPPARAAWLPNLAFTVLGLYLFHRRITGRPIYLVLRRLVPGND